MLAWLWPFALAVAATKVALVATLPVVPVSKDSMEGPLNAPETANGSVFLHSRTTSSEERLAEQAREQLAEDFLTWMQERELKEARRPFPDEADQATSMPKNLIKEAAMKTKALVNTSVLERASRQVTLKKALSHSHENSSSHRSSRRQTSRVRAHSHARAHSRASARAHVRLRRSQRSARRSSHQANHSLKSNALQSNHHHELMPAATKMCDDDELDNWGKRRMMQNLFAIWNKHFPDSAVFSHSTMADTGCVIQGVTHFADSIKESTFPLQPAHGAQVMSLVWDGIKQICNTWQEPWHTFEPWHFKVGEPLNSRGEERLVATVMPRARHCAGRGCPVVVFLSGVGEHSDSLTSPVVHNDTALFDASFDKIRKWGLLKYAENDKNCMGSLGSVVLAPELDRHETWVTHGQELMTHFILPLLAFTKSQHPKEVDTKRVGVVGYSEGAFGALQAAVQYPDVFSIAIAASGSTSDSWWQDVPMPNKPQELNATNIKLRAVVAAYGELDDVGVDLPGNFERTLDWLRAYGIPKHSSLLVQLYAGLPHQGVWDYVYNRWPAFHEVVWRGNYNFHLK